MSLSQVKASLRRQLSARRRGATQAKRQQWSGSAQRHLLSTPLWQGARSVALYHPFPTEVSTALLLEHAFAQGKAVALPITPAMGRPLRFVQVHPDTPRIPGPMNTQEPPASCTDLPLSEVDLVVLPGLGWDRSGTRLGYGGGYYDRSLVGVSAPCVQLAFGLQEQPGLPRGPYDRPMLAVATEQGLYFT